MSECLTESQRNLWLGYNRDAQPWAGPTALTCGRVDQTRLLPHAELLAPSDPRRLRAVEVSVDQEECVRREREIEREVWRKGERVQEGIRGVVVDCELMSQALGMHESANFVSLRFCVLDNNIRNFMCVK
jgi:hypothetical protein